MKRKNHLLISVLLSLVMLFSLIVPAVTAEPGSCSGPKVVPVTVSGNPKCEGEYSKKIDSPPKNGSFIINDTGTVLFYNHNGKYLSWYVSPAAINITQVVVKGGPNANIYRYTEEPVYADCGLHSPDHPREGQIPDISHISFTWGNAPPNIVTGSISGTKYEWINENKLGDGLGGWDIMLFNNKPNNPTDEDDDTFVKKAITESSGTYSFTNLLPGTYYVYEILQEKWIQKGPENGCHIITISDDSSQNDYVGIDFWNQKDDDDNSKGSIRVIKFLGQNDDIIYPTEVMNEYGPRISIEKTGPQNAAAGDTINYSFTVRNSGNVKLYDVVVTDGLFGSDWKKEINELAVGESYNFNKEYIIPSSYSPGSTLTNTAEVVGYYTCDGYNENIPMAIANQTDSCLCSCPWADGTRMSGVEFTLYKVNGEENEFVARRTTAENGEILFSGLDPGNYYLEEDVDEGEYVTIYCPSQKNNITVEANKENTVCVLNTPYTKCPVYATDSHMVTITPDNGSEKASLKIHKFNDANKNGVRDAGEKEIEWTVDLEVSLGDNQWSPLESSLSTPVDLKLDPGIYRVTEETRTNWTATTPTSKTVTLKSGESQTVDFGNYYQKPSNGGDNGGDDDDDDSGSASLNVFKFNDANKNGIWDAGEEEIKGWKIFVNGREYFTPVRITVDPASYTVEEEAKTDWEAYTDTSFSFTLNNGDTKTIHFGNCPVNVEKEYPPDDPSTPPEEPEEEPEVEKDIPPDKPSTPPEEPKDEPEEERIIPPEPPAQTSPPRPELPRTGSNSLLFTGLGVLLGTAGFFLKRRKR